MKKIVDLDEFKEEIKKIANASYFNIDASADVATRIREWLEKQPDVGEKRGKWEAINISITNTINNLTHTRSGYKCSECGRIKGSKELYCNCGAKMDLGEEK